MTAHEANRSRWTQLMAPRSGDVLSELLDEAAEFYGISPTEARSRAERATEAFTDEWRQKQVDPSNPNQVIDFYNTSETEVFDLIRWHAEDDIHHRTFTCVDLAVRNGARELLDYGSGIGSDALVATAAGLSVTIADISDPLLSFATWRCRRRGYTVSALDLKREAPPAGHYDAAICFDVLELRRLKAILVEKIGNEKFEDIRARTRFNSPHPRN